MVSVNIAWLRKARFMEPGAFSISLAVKDIKASKVFYDLYRKRMRIRRAGKFYGAGADGNPILVDQHV